MFLFLFYLLLIIIIIIIFKVHSTVYYKFFKGLTFGHGRTKTRPPRIKEPREGLPSNQTT